MSRTSGAGRSGQGALRSEAAVRPAEPGAAERHRADRGAADPHRPDSDAADLDGTDRGAADLHGTDRGAADLNGTDRDAADLRPIDPGVPAGADPAAPLRAVVADDHPVVRDGLVAIDRKSTRLNSSHVATSYAGFCLKRKKTNIASRHFGGIGG